MSWIDKLKDLHDRVTAARAGKLDYLQNLEDGVYFDSVLGSAGTDWPYGTAQNPSNNIADVITICAARKTKKIYVSGSLTIGATMQSYIFVGREALWTTIDLNSQNVDGSSFENFVFSVGNVQGGTAKMYCKNCFFLGIAGLMADLDDSTVITAALANTSMLWKNVVLLNTLNCASFTGGPGSLNISGMRGAVAIINLTGGSVTMDGTGYAQGAASDTGGTITLCGNIKWYLNGATSTVVDHTVDARIGTPAGASVSADIAALKTVADAIPTTAMRGTDNALLASEGETTTLNAGDGTVTNASRLGKLARWIADAINNGTYGLSALQTLLAAIPTTAMRGTDNAALASEWTSTRAGYVDNLSGGAVALASNCDAKSSDIKTKTDKITLPVYRQIFKSADSAMLASLAFGSVAADKDFPSVVATAKPTGATITKAYWGFSYSKKVDSSDGANAVNAADKAVRVKVSTGAWGTDDIVAYTFANGALSTPASATEGGMMIMGSVDIKSVVDGSAATFNFRSEETERSDALTVTGASLTFYDVESWLIVEYTL